MVILVSQAGIEITCCLITEGCVISLHPVYYTGHIVTISFGYILYCVCFNLYCGCCNLFCNVWACVCVGFVMCGCV